MKSDPLQPSCQNRIIAARFIQYFEEGDPMADPIPVVETEAKTLWAKFVALVKSAPVVFVVGAIAGFVLKGLI